MIMLVSLQLQESADDSAAPRQPRQKSAAADDVDDLEMEQALRPIVTLPESIFETSPLSQQEAAFFKGLIGRLNFLLGTSVRPSDPIQKITELFRRGAEYVRTKSVPAPVVDLESFTPAHQRALVKMNDNFAHHYTQRREVLLQRLKATLQSFVWSDLGESRLKEISIVIQDMLREVPVESNISLFEFYAAVPVSSICAPCTFHD